MARAPRRPAVMALVAAFLASILPGVAAQPAAAASPDVVISQVYGGGGNSGATYTNDFVELFNRGSDAVSVTGWSIQYASAAGSTWAVTGLTGALEPGQYYLVQEAQGAGGTVPLPTPQATGTIAMSATSGKVALVNSTTALTGTCPTAVVDFVGFGAANCAEGSAPTATLSNTASASRAAAGCTDTDDNSADFTVGAPAPRNADTALAPCGAGDSAPVVSTTVPANEAEGVALDADLTITFSEPVTLGDGHTTISCEASGVHTYVTGGGPATYTLDPDSDLAADEGCTVTVSAAAVTDADTDDPPDSMAGDHVFTFQTAAAVVETPDINISQVYGGGGNAGATLKNDFIELYNPGTEAVSLAGWSVQYASSTGNFNQVTPLSGSIAAGRYYLIQEAAGAGGSVDLPTPDATGTIAMSGTNGKVALVQSTALLGTSCSGGDLIDLVGYGSANCAEGSPTAALSNTTAALRNAGGATDTDNNAADFTIGAPNPRPSTEAPPAVASTFPSNGAANIAAFSTLTVTFTEPVTATGSWSTLTCTTSGTHTSTVGGGPTAFTIDPDGSFAGGETCTLTVLATNVTDNDTADPPDAMEANAVIEFTVAPDIACFDPATAISAIQGSGTASPMLNATVEIEGVVVGAYPGTTRFRGLHVQEEDADQDGDAATSEGIFIFDGNGGAEYAVGDLVRIRGRVAEFDSSGQTLTQLTSLTNLVTCDTGASVTPADVSLPFPSPTFAERYEGMLVSIDQVLTVTETFGLGRFGEVILSSGGRLFTPTHLVEPGAPAIALQAQNDLRRIVLDDGDNRQNLDPTLYPTGGLSAADTLRVGDTTDGGTFVLEQRFGTYRLQPTPAGVLPTWESTNPRPAEAPEVGGDLRVAAMNVLNYFTTFDTIRGSNNGPNICGPLENQECRGANTAFEFERQRTKIIEAILGLDASVVGLMEIENNASASTQDLVDGLNAEAGAGTWAFVDTGTIGGDAIKVALIYRPADVTPVGAHAILDSDVDPRFDDSRSRPALAQTFDAMGGGRFTVIVNHLKSKGSACEGDPDTGDGQGNCNETRTLAAEALVDWIATDPTGSGDRDVLVIGDLNSYAQEDPIQVFGDAGYVDTLAASLGSHAYSYVFQGQTGYLDHALASPTLAAQVTGAAEWHINADEPPVLDYNDDFKSSGHVNSLYAPDPYRSSDHDPLVVGLDLLDFGFEGFLPPLASEGPSTAKAGSTVPIRFRLPLTTGLDVLFATPVSWQVDCETREALGDPANTTATVGLTQDGPGGSYTYDWKTLKSWSTTCRTVELTFDDGAYRQATVHFTR